MRFGYPLLYPLGTTIIFRRSGLSKKNNKKMILSSSPEQQGVQVPHETITRLQSLLSQLLTPQSSEQEDEREWNVVS